MKLLVIIESPYAGNIRLNEAYLNACLRDSLLRGEAPFASHGLYTKALNDNNPEERDLGITSGLEYYRVANKCVVYSDLGISPGMAKGIDKAESLGIPIEYRKLNSLIVEDVRSRYEGETVILYDKPPTQEYHESWFLYPKEIS